MARDSYYKKCPHCGLNLDPGEKCDCQKPSLIIHSLDPSEKDVVIHPETSKAEEEWDPDWSVKCQRCGMRHAFLTRMEGAYRAFKVYLCDECEKKFFIHARGFLNGK